MMKAEILSTSGKCPMMYDGTFTRVSRAQNSINSKKRDVRDHCRLAVRYGVTSIAAQSKGRRFKV